MRPADQLARYVHDALVAGQSRAAIDDALTRAGWTKGEIAAALGAWDDAPSGPPVPRPRPFVSAREAFLHGLMFVALATIAWHLVSLSFALVDRFLPDIDSLGHASVPVQSMRFSIATLIVFVPLFGWLDRYTRRVALSDAGARRSLVRKWFSHATLFLASLALLGDLIAAIYALLNGDMTARFAAKGLVVAVVALVILAYFRAELDDGDVR